MKRIGFLSVAFAAILTVACGGDGRNDANRAHDDAAMAPGAGRTPGAEGTAGADVSRGARNWVEDRMKGNRAEVKLGELASERAQHADVKAFGRTMVQDHTKANEELTQIASQHNVQPPVEVDNDTRDLMNRLSQLQGAEFDREYMNAMVDAHEDTLEALEDRVEKEGEDRNPRYTPKEDDDAFESRLNQWAAKTAPTVHQHLERARALNDQVGRRLTER